MFCDLYYIIFVIYLLYFPPSANDKMKFGSLISTSNKFDDDAEEVMISTDTELIWTMEVEMNS